MTEYPRRGVERAELNELFNDNQYWERAQAGEFTVELKTNRHRQDPTPSLPYCTHSQIIRYIDHAGATIAVVHQMRLPDGRIGGSGRPEPKALWFGGEMRYVE